MVVTRPLQYPDFADPYRVLCVFPIENSDEQRLPAYSGATVPDLHRLPVADVLSELATPATSPLKGEGDARKGSALCARVGRKIVLSAEPLSLNETDIKIGDEPYGCRVAHSSSPRGSAAKSSGTRSALLFSRRRARSRYFRVVRRSACPTSSAMCSSSAPPARARVMLVARNPWALGTRTPAACIARLPTAARRRGRIAPSLREVKRALVS